MASKATILLSVLAPWAAAQAATVPEQLRACGDRSGFPPYTMKLEENQGIEGARGFNVDFLNALLAQQQRSVRYDLLPWKRCLNLARQGRYDIVLDLANTPGRTRDYLLAESHYSVTPIIVYHPQRPIPPLRAQAELGNYQRCELLGWDYSTSGLPLADEARLTRPTSLESAFAMLRAGRCQLLIFDEELLKSGDDNPGATWMQGLAYHPYPGLSSYKLHFGVSRQVGYAAELQAMLNDGVQRMHRSGETARLLKRYQPR